MTVKCSYCGKEFRQNGGGVMAHIYLCREKAAKEKSPGEKLDDFLKDRSDSPGQQPQDSSPRTPQDSPGDQPQDSPGDQPQDSPGDQPQDSPGDQPQDSPGDQPQDSPGDQPQDSQGNIPDILLIPIIFIIGIMYFIFKFWRE